MSTTADSSASPSPTAHGVAARRWLAHFASCYGNDFPLPTPALAATSTPSVPAPSATRNAVEAPIPGRVHTEATAGEEAPTATPTPPEPIERSAAVAQTASTLDELRDVCSACRRCRLAEGRKNVVFGEGAPDAEVMFVGEAPGKTEDETGRPFVGRAGQLLTRIIENAMGMPRREVFIANANKCRPPGNRDPQPDEIGACLPFLKRQIELVQPRVVVALGRVAANNLLGHSEPRPMRRMRGADLSFEGIPLVATWHPAYLLRNDSAKGETWADIKRVNRLLGRAEIPPPWRGDRT